MEDVICMPHIMIRLMSPSRVGIMKYGVLNYARHVDEKREEMHTKFCRETPWNTSILLHGSMI